MYHVITNKEMKGKKKRKKGKKTKKKQQQQQRFTAPILMPTNFTPSNDNTDVRTASAFIMRLVLIALSLFVCGGNQGRGCSPLTPNKVNKAERETAWVWTTKWHQKTTQCFRPKRGPFYDRDKYLSRSSDHHTHYPLYIIHISVS